MRYMNRSNMKVLVSNDDGIHAEGLASLCNSLSSLNLEVYVCAPDRERSAASHALTMYTPLRCHAVDSPGFQAKKAWTADGTPADCVKIALELLMKDDLPDFVVSGINRGPNLGNDILYSGTVAAAAEGCFFGIPSMAVSCTAKRKPDYNAASAFITDHFLGLMENGLPQGTMLNVNVPPEAKTEAGKAVLRFTKAGTMKYADIFEVRNDPRGKQYLWMSGEPVEVDTDPTFDTVTIRNGYVSVTPVRFELTDDEYLNSLRDNNREK